jgi:gliding motility-associated-like protein
MRYRIPKHLFVLFLVIAFLRGSGQTASFTMPSQVCTNTPVTISNTSTGGSTYYWSFCSADLTQTPAALSWSNLTTSPQEPVFIDIYEENNNYYGLMTIHYPGNLARLDFGNSLLNTPTVNYFGNLGVLNPGYGTEGIQVVKNNGHVYAIVVGGSTTDNVGEAPQIVKVDFGSTITNPAPVATNWGNLGNMDLPIEFYLFQESGLWHGFTVNCESNTLTRFDFGADFTNPPTAVNLGNPGGLLNYPCGIYAVNDGGVWRIFVSNGQPNISNTLVRLDFGASLLNTPTPVNLGNPGNTITSARAMVILQNCDQTEGFLTDGSSHSLVRLDFHNDLTSVPSATNLGNLAGWNFPHSLSKIFRVGADLYSLVPDAFAGTVTRLRFAGCTNSSIANSAATDPPSVSWSQPGTYRVNLTMDEGLPTQAAFCQSIVVGQAAPVSLGDDTTLCSGDSLVLRYTGPPATYAWQDGSSQDTFTVHIQGQYSLTATEAAGCSASGSIAINYLARPMVSTIPDATVCQGSSLQLTSEALSADSVRWAPAAGLSDAFEISPIANPNVTTSYTLTAWHGKCPSSDTVVVTVLDVPVLSIAADTVICTGITTRLTAMGGQSYSWYPVQGLSDPTIADPLASPASSMKYYVKGTGANLCSSLDSVHIRVKLPEVFSVSAQPAEICPGDSSLLTASGAELYDGDSYTWQSLSGSQDPHAPAIFVSPSASTVYEVIAMDKVCNQSATLKVDVDVLAKPTLSVAKSNDIGCIYGEATLTVTGGIRYEWTPAATLSDPTSASPVARTDATTVYWVLGVGDNGCTALDSIAVVVTKGSGIGFPVANAFTPNGDGANDRFGIKYWGYISSFQLSVFNRQGMLVFASENPDLGWDGTFKGQPQPTGTYTYMIRANTLCGTAVKKGTVELIR